MNTEYSQLASNITDAGESQTEAHFPRSSNELPDTFSTASDFEPAERMAEPYSDRDSTFKHENWPELEPAGYKQSGRKVSYLCFLLVAGILGGWALLVTGLFAYEHHALQKLHALLNPSSAKNSSLGSDFADIMPDTSLNSTTKKHKLVPLRHDDPPVPPRKSPKRPKHNVAKAKTKSGKKRFTYSDANAYTFYPSFERTAWLKYPDYDGFVLESDEIGVKLTFVANDTSKILVPAEEFVDVNGANLSFLPIEISADLKYILVLKSRIRQWRHSGFNEYVVFDIGKKQAKRLTNGTNHPVSYATWSPTGHSIMFIKKNNLYVNVDLTEERQITFDGSATVFNGIPDWVYEEEVYSQDFACWWSPNSASVAYLRLDETKVPIFEYPVYEDPGLPENAYPVKREIRYPKPGYPNPIASVHVYNLNDAKPDKRAPVPAISFEGNDFTDSDRLLVEVSWMSNEKLFVRAMNRVQDNSRLWLIDSTKNDAKMVREELGVSNKDDCWIDIEKILKYVPAQQPDRPKDGYIDYVYKDGWKHLAYFSTLDASQPTSWITSGEWEVVNLASMDVKSGVVYFISTERGPTERHLYKAKLDGSDKKALTSNDEGSYHTEFSPSSEWYVLSYGGPEIPWQILKNSRDPKFEKNIKTFGDLKRRMNEYDMPIKRYGKITADGVEMNTLEIVPPDFNTTDTQDTKYGVLFRVYGGPNSQMVDKAFFKYDWNAAVTTDPEMQMILVYVDGRGSGFKGRKFRCPVRRNLGDLESLDLVNAAKHWSKLPYVDPKRIAVWGWSYGGYLTAKTIERDSGVFSAGASVAPVTDWRFYDTIYTERYMLTPKENPKGYAAGAVSKPEGFQHAKYLLIHGTGDDNVHFQQTAHLIDMFTQKSVRGYRLQVFTDNDHSMGFHGANRELYVLLRQFLKDALPINSHLERRDTMSRWTRI